MPSLFTQQRRIMLLLFLYHDFNCLYFFLGFFIITLLLYVD